LSNAELLGELNDDPFKQPMFLDPVRIVHLSVRQRPPLRSDFGNTTFMYAGNAAMAWSREGSVLDHPSPRLHSASDACGGVALDASQRVRIVADFKPGHFSNWRMWN
jgi:hypothetical protein